MTAASVWKKFGRLAIDVVFFGLCLFAVIFGGLYIAKENTIRDLINSITSTSYSASQLLAQPDMIVAWAAVGIGAVAVLSIFFSVIFFWRKPQWGWTMFNFILVCIVVGLGIYIAVKYTKVYGIKTKDDLLAIFS